MRSSETPHCPVCDSLLYVSGSRKRRLREADGSQSILIVRRLRCGHCCRIHHELPDAVVPYKRYCSETVEEILSGKDSSTYPCENSTAARLRTWFLLLREYCESALTAIMHLYKQDRQLKEELSALIPLDPAVLPAGWLKKVVRALVGAGFWQQTRSA